MLPGFVPGKAGFWGMFLIYTIRIGLIVSLQGLMHMSSTPQSRGSSCFALPEPSVCEVWFVKPTDDYYWLARERVTLTHHCPTSQLS